MWLFPGDTLETAELSITSLPDGGTTYYDQTVNFTQGACTPNSFGYNVCTENTFFNGPTLNGGSYWLNLQNAQVPSGDPVYWDQNNGPNVNLNAAWENTIGSIPSETFHPLRRDHLFQGRAGAIRSGTRQHSDVCHRGAGIRELATEQIFEMTSSATFCSASQHLAAQQCHDIDTVELFDKKSRHFVT